MKENGVVHYLSNFEVIPSTFGVQQTARGGLELDSEKLSFTTIPARFLEAAKKRYGPTGQIGLTAWVDAEHCVFGFHSCLRLSRFSLHCINRMTSKLIWSAKVWGHSGFWGGTGSGGFHWVEIRRSDDTLCLFGMDYHRVYIEGHSMKDGANLFHFTTSN